MKKVKLIFNPIANLGRAWHIAASLRPIVYELGGADWAGTVYPGHASEIAHQAALEGYDVVVAMGGDGTVHEVINGLMKVPRDRRPRLGIVPLGSGNDFAFSIGISDRPDLALRQALSGQPRPVDIGQIIDGHGRVEYWINAIGIGFDTVVTINSRRVPFFQGYAVYFLAVLQTIAFNYFPFRLSIQTENETWERELLMLVLCNGPREGGGFFLAPNARPDDGLFTYLSVDRISRPMMLYTLIRFLNHTHQSLPYIHMAEFKRLTLTSDRPLYIHADGEILAGFGSTTNRLDVQLLSGELDAVV